MLQESVNRIAFPAVLSLDTDELSAAEILDQPSVATQKLVNYP